MRDLSGLDFVEVQNGHVFKENNKMDTSSVSRASTLVEHEGCCWNVHNATLLVNFCLRIDPHERLNTLAKFVVMS